MATATRKTKATNKKTATTGSRITRMLDKVAKTATKVARGKGITSPLVKSSPKSRTTKKMGSKTKAGRGSLRLVKGKAA